MRMLAEAWDALGGDPAQVDRVRLTGPGTTLPSRLPVTALAQASIAAAGLAAGPAATGGVEVDSRAAAVAFTSERHLRVDGRPQDAWDPLSSFIRAADGWVRLHANYPHHRERLLRALGVTAADEIPGAVATLRAEEVERTVTVQGGLAVAVRTPEEWRAHPAGAAVRDTPLVAWRRLTDRRVRLRRPGRPRVLDLTRVIAGPVATRTLALFGADVLRVDPPDLPELPAQHLDTGFGKRSTLLDLRVDRHRWESLLGEADVLVCGYRLGALDRYGLAPAALGERHPHLVVATLNAWGPTGPWAGRRGFDSLVQAACGLAAVSSDDGHPGRLPAQALDHATGYLLAAAVLRALADGSGGLHVHLSLARTAAWLLDHVGDPQPPALEWDPSPWITRTGTLTHALPPFAGPGAPPNWSHPPVPWGSSEPAWLPLP